MKYFKQISSILYILFLINTLLGMTASADELLKLGNFEENSQPSYGENIAVFQDEQTGLKWVSATNDTTGKIEIPIILSTSAFEFTIEMFDAGNRVEFFFTRGEQNLKFSVFGSGGTLILEDDSSTEIDSWQDNGRNSVRLEVMNGIARIFVNEVFNKKVVLDTDKANALYDKLILTNIDDKHIIYNMTLTNGVSGSKFAADLSRDLVNLSIPQVNYDAAEGARVLWADLKRYPNAEGKILFEVVDFGNYPK